jgi:hypothetical protein
MAQLTWFPEPFQAYGSFAGDGARRLLGKPKLDPLTVLVRETVQNSWDARCRDRGSIGFAMDCWGLGADQLHTLRHDVFAELPPHGIDLGHVLDREEVGVLVVSDRGTLGLTGPVRADVSATERTDFADLVFNMGQPRDVEGGGGTYGFGKTIAYVVSEASTVILYTRTQVDAELETRLIAVAVGSQYATDAHRFTGRHWWGIAAGNVVEPLTGADAEHLARRLGFPGFESAETGLSMMILAPKFNGRTTRQAMTFIANSLSWHFWPKMITRHAGRGTVPIAFRVSCEGEAVAVPDPEDHPPLGIYVTALRALHAHDDGEEIDTTVAVQPIRMLRPNRQLGLLALTRDVHKSRRVLDDGSDPDDDVEESAPFAGNSHHVALMRRVELVVKYLPGPELPGAHVEWAGVFVNDVDIDAAFADAEPPTHDDWQPGMVEDKRRRRLVNRALQNIGGAVRAAFGAATPSPISGTDHSAVVIGNALGGLIAAVTGTSPLKPPAPADGRDGNGREGPTDVGNGKPDRDSVSSRATIGAMVTRPALFDGEPATEVEFRVDTHGSSSRVVGEAHAAIDGAGQEREPPIGAATPSVIGWRRPSETGVSILGPELAVEADDNEPWVMVVANPAETAVAVDVRAVDSMQ